MARTTPRIMRFRDASTPSRTWYRFRVMTAVAAAVTKLCWSAIGAVPSAVDDVIFRGSGGLASPFAVTDVASAAVATAALAVAEFLSEVHGVRASIVVDRRM